jgi:hypothetical protein
MSWNLLILKAGKNYSDWLPLPMGSLADVTRTLTTAFPNLEWRSELLCELNVNLGFRIELEVKGGQVRSLFTSGGFNHLSELAAICKNHGWEIGDCQEGESIDLDDPYGWYDKKWPKYAPHGPYMRSKETDHQ